MKDVRNIQMLTWILFMVYYCLSKFFAGYQGYSHAYLLQVVLIVSLTAVVPFYLSRWLMQFNTIRLPAVFVLPSVLAMSGYAGFFAVFIAPNFPDVPAFAVIVRGLLPGIAISLILGLPGMLARFGYPSAD